MKPVPPVTNCEIASVKPHSGISRGGAVGYSQYPIRAKAIAIMNMLRTK